jgi:hypothetical protein
MSEIICVCGHLLADHLECYPEHTPACRNCFCGKFEKSEPAAPVQASGTMSEERLQRGDYCKARDPHSPRVCDRVRGHQGWHDDSTMPLGAIERKGTNLAIVELERSAPAQPEKGTLCRSTTETQHGGATNTAAIKSGSLDNSSAQSAAQSEPAAPAQANEQLRCSICHAQTYSADELVAHYRNEHEVNAIVIEVGRTRQGTLAQSVEQRTHNSLGAGSIPASPTNPPAHTADCDEQLKALSGAHYPCTCDVEAARACAIEVLANCALRYVADPDNIVGLTMLEVQSYTDQAIADAQKIVAAYAASETAQMLLRIRASLKARAEGRNEGGDIEVMEAVDAIVASETAALRDKMEAATDNFVEEKLRADRAEAENERLQALVATCERDIGLALADYHNSQAQVREWKARQAESFAFYEDEVRQLKSCQAQLAQMRELMEEFRDAADEFVSKRFRAYAREVLSSTASSAAWLEKHDAEVAAKAEQQWMPVDSGELPKPWAGVLTWSSLESVMKCHYRGDGTWGIYSGDADIVVTHWRPLPVPPDALAGEQPTPPEA